MDQGSKMKLCRTMSHIMIAIVVAIALVHVPDQLFGCAEMDRSPHLFGGTDIPFRAGLRNEVLRLSIGLILVFALTHWVRHTPSAMARPCIPLGALLVLVLSLNMAAKIAALLFFSHAASLSNIDQVQLMTIAHTFLWVHEQGERTAAVFCGIWVFFVLSQQARDIAHARREDSDHRPANNS